MDQDPHFVGTNGGRIFRLTVAQMAWATCPSPTVRHKPTGRCPCHNESTDFRSAPGGGRDAGF